MEASQVRRSTKKMQNTKEVKRRTKAYHQNKLFVRLRMYFVDFVVKLQRRHKS